MKSNFKTTIIAVLGMGYVGCVSAACLADMGHHVTGVDVDPHKLAMLRRHQPPIMEAGLDTLLGAVMESGRLRVTDDTAEAVREANVTMICVGTPSRPNGSLETAHLDRVVQQVGAALTDADQYRVIAVRSTLLPGVLAERIIPVLEAASGRKAGVDFGVFINPEFLRESTGGSFFPASGRSAFALRATARPRRSLGGGGGAVDLMCPRRRFSDHEFGRLAKQISF